MLNHKYWHGLCKFHYKVYTFGGRVWNQQLSLNCVEVYNPKSNEWKELSNMPISSSISNVVSYESKIYMSGLNTRGVLAYIPLTDQFETVQIQNSDFHISKVLISVGKEIMLADQRGLYIFDKESGKKQNKINLSLVNVSHYQNKEQAPFQYKRRIYYSSGWMYYSFDLDSGHLEKF